MLRTILSVLLGVVFWIIGVTVLDHGLRAVLPGYAEAIPNFAFTLPMQAGRLIEGALITLAAGALAALIAPPPRVGPIVLGVLMTALFIPLHISLWSKFPLWYHLTFLLTLLPLTLLGARLARQKVTAD